MRITLIMFSLILVACQSKIVPPERFIASKSDSRRFEHLSPLQNMMELKRKARGEVAYCKDIDIKRGHKYVDVSVNGQTTRFHVKKDNDEWDVTSQTTDDYWVLKNQKLPFYDDPMSFSVCPDCYLQNESRTVVVYPPPIGPTFHGFEVKVDRGGKTEILAECGVIPRREQ